MHLHLILSKSKLLKAENPSDLIAGRFLISDATGFEFQNRLPDITLLSESERFTGKPPKNEQELIIVSRSA